MTRLHSFFRRTGFVVSAFRRTGFVVSAFRRTGFVVSAFRRTWRSPAKTGHYGSLVVSAFRRTWRSAAKAGTLRISSSVRLQADLAKSG